jgi:glutathione S-transferase
MKGVFGNEDIFMSSWNEASKDLKAHCKVINNALEGKQWLVGNSITLADVLVASTLSLPL